MIKIISAKVIVKADIVRYPDKTIDETLETLTQRFEDKIKGCLMHDINVIEVLVSGWTEP